MIANTKFTLLFISSVILLAAASEDVSTRKPRNPNANVPERCPRPSSLTTCGGMLRDESCTMDGEKKCSRMGMRHCCPMGTADSNEGCCRMTSMTLRTDDQAHNGIASRIRNRVESRVHNRIDGARDRMGTGGSSGIGSRVLDRVERRLNRLGK